MSREIEPIYRFKVNDVYIRVDKIITPCRCIVTNCQETDCYDIQLEKPEGLSFIGGTLCKRHFEEAIQALKQEQQKYTRQRHCDCCGILLTKGNNKCGYELCDECNERLEQKYGKGQGMTREEAIEYNKNLRMYMKISDKNEPYKFLEENYIALDMAIKALEQEPSNDMVSRGVFEQVMWERDVAIEQLHELGYELGEKIRTTTTAGEGDTYKYLLHGAESLVKENPEVIEALQDIQKGEGE